MDRQTIRTLEFNQIQEILRRYAQSPLGQSEIEALAVHRDPARVRFLLDCAAEMSALIKERGRPSLGGSSDLGPILGRAGVEGACLGTEDLVQTLGLIHAGQGIKGFLGRASGEYPILREKAGRVDPLSDLGEAIAEIVDARGGIRDSASAALAGIRRRIHQQKERVRERLEGILSSDTLGPVVQERLVTVRNDRYVIPLKPDFSSRIQGIIHDHSASGATVFVEPSETVEMNNRLSELSSEEAEEIHRILLGMTGRIRSCSDALRMNQEVLARMDLHLAKALFAAEYGAVIPEIVREQKIDIMGARHPLLIGRNKGKTEAAVVPVDLKIGEGYRTLIITGPNAGGKTVALKTLGLLVLMAQAGIPIPAAKGSCMGVMGEVFADIGDDQSIQEDLSTFSGHIRNIVRILRESDRKSLVLLDELGTGTDPREGAALGLAVLEELAGKGCLLAGTTHYEEIKHHAYGADGMMNASVAFDSESLRPAYVLEYGRLGTSHAFEISDRIGMPRDVLDAARQRMSDFDKNASRLIEELEEQIRENREVRLGLKQREQEMARLLSEEQEKKEEVLREAREVLKDLRRQFTRTKKRARILLRLAEQGNRKRLDQEIREMTEELETDTPLLAAPAGSMDRERLGPGARVEIAGTGKEGVVLSGPDKRDRVHVLCNGLKMEVRADRLRIAAGRASNERPRIAVGAELHSLEETGSSINLIGLRTEEAKRRTERYLDQAHLGNRRSVRIIHGIGTGALRDAVAETLRSHPLVADFRAGDPGEGGSGVTLAELT